MAKAKKQVEVVDKPKKVVSKPKVSDYSLFDNRSSKADLRTQTVSNKKLIKPILHSLGLTLGKSDPIIYNSNNIELANKIVNKATANVIASGKFHKYN